MPWLTSSEILLFSKFPPGVDGTPRRPCEESPWLILLCDCDYFVSYPPSMDYLLSPHIAEGRLVCRWWQLALFEPKKATTSSYDAGERGVGFCLPQGGYEMEIVMVDTYFVIGTREARIISSGVPFQIKGGYPLDNTRGPKIDSIHCPLNLPN